MEEKGVNLIGNMKIARRLAIVLINISLMIQVVEFIFNIMDAFSFETLFAFVFEIITNGILIYALNRKKPVLIEIALIVIKIFEATYYPLRSCQRLDTITAIAEVPTFYIVVHIMFAIGAFSLLFGLIFYCVYKVWDSIRFWDIMKIWIILASIFMLINTILYAVELSKNQDMRWTEILEPIALTILFAGMFVTYEYVEKEIIYNEEISAS